MARQSKEALLKEFSQTWGANNCKSVADLEQKFASWMRRNNKSLNYRGKDYFDNDFYGSANYTKTILQKNKGLMRSFGLSEKDLVNSKPDYRDNIKDGYSLLGQFKHYGNQVHNVGQRSDIRKNGAKAYFNGGMGKLILVAVTLVLIYQLFGDTVYSFLTSGAVFKLILFIGAAFVSFKVLTSKNMGWPLPIKLIVLFVIWLVLLNYDF